MNGAGLRKPRCAVTLFAAVLLCGFCGTASTVLTPASVVRLVNNGYEGLLISIHERVNESEALVESIAKTFIQASKALFIASGRRVYFKNISILVPESWNRGSYAPATWQTYSNAPIRIDNAAGLTRPYVSHYTKCGEPGEYMMLPEIMFKDWYKALHKTEEERAKEIVHRWAHLRWGLFDEYPIAENDAHFYLSSTGMIEPVRCSKAIGGEIICPASNGNSHDRNINYYNERCWFNPKDNSSSENSASYMYSYTLKKITGFCDNDPSNPATLHNSEAPNRHNMMCGGRSAWEVMRQHKDFLDANSVPRDQNFVALAVPHISVVKRSAAAYALVMDVSGSMGDDYNCIKLSDAVKKFIQTVIPEGSLVGLVQFNNTATALTPDLHRVNSEESRLRLAAMVSPLADGWTSIGAGMLRAYQLFQGRNVMRGSTMIVITDGYENTPPLVKDVLPSIQAAGIVVDALLLTQHADQQLINSSSATGGRSYFVSGANDAVGISDVLNRMAESQQASEESSPVLIATRAIPVSGYSTSYERVIVDGELGRDLVFGFEWPTHRVLSLTLTSPITGRNYTSEVGYGNLSHTAVLPGISETGKWQISITNRQPRDVRVTARVQSKVKDQSSLAPVIVNFLLSKTDVNFSGSDEPPILYATVTKGYAPVINATVTASLINENGETIDFELRDNGAGADVTKDDGTYSRYLPELNATGMYSTRVRVEGHSGTRMDLGFLGRTILTSNSENNSSNATSLESITEDSWNGTTAPVHPFERVSFGSLIRVVGVRITDVVRGQPAADSVPPSRIHDFTLLETSPEYRTITVRFTAVGDNFDEGRASRYHIRNAPSSQRLYSAFNNCTPVDNADLVNATLTAPKEPGSIEIFVIRVKVGVVMALAVVAEDEAGNLGQLSNVITARIDYKPSTPTERFLETSTTAHPSNARDPHGRVAGVAASDAQDKHRLLVMTIVTCLSIAGLLIVITAVIIAQGQKRKKRDHRTSSSRRDKSGVDNIVFSELLEHAQRTGITTASESDRRAKLASLGAVDKNFARQLQV